MAAANPNGGRYDRSKSLKQNIDMTAPIMSRFDLFFILVDDCNEVTDYAIARRIIDLHTKLEESVERTYTVAEITRSVTLIKHLMECCNDFCHLYRFIKICQAKIFRYDTGVPPF